MLIFFGDLARRFSAEHKKWIIALLVEKGGACKADDIYVMGEEKHCESNFVAEFFLHFFGRCFWRLTSDIRFELLFCFMFVSQVIVALSLSIYFWLCMPEPHPHTHTSHPIHR